MTKEQVDDDEMPAEVDLSRSIPNPYFVAYHGPKVIRVLEPDLAELFPDNESVNAALRKVSARRLAAPRKKTR